MPKFRYAKPAPIKRQGYFPAAILPIAVASGFIAGTAPVDITGDGKLKYNLSYLRVTTLFTPTRITGFRARSTFSCLYKLACCVCLSGSINEVEFARRLWGDIYFNNKTSVAIAYLFLVICQPS